MTLEHDAVRLMQDAAELRQKLMSEWLTERERRDVLALLRTTASEVETAIDQVIERRVA